LLLLYADAERLLPRLTLELEQVESSVRAAGYRTALKMAPLKESGRAVVKAMEKYQGSYDCLTDLARCTFECPTLAAATAVLDALAGSQVMDVLLIKNRLMLAYDASPSGGYRDLLINVRLKDPNLPHIAEIQITLTPLLQLKTGGGHTAYALGRLLNLFDPETWRYDGLLSPRGSRTPSTPAWSATSPAPARCRSTWARWGAPSPRRPARSRRYGSSSARGPPRSWCATC